MRIEKIIFEYENWADFDTSQLTTGESCVTILFDNGKLYHAWLVTPDYIAQHMREHNEQHFWVTDMVIIERMDHDTVERAVQSLIEKDRFELVFNQNPEEVWLFFGNTSEKPSGAFTRLGTAEHHIERRKLTGTLVQYPVDNTLLSWVMGENVFNDDVYEYYETLQKKPDFEANFVSAELASYRYEAGKRVR